MSRSRDLPDREPPQPAAAGSASLAWVPGKADQGAAAEGIEVGCLHATTQPSRLSELGKSAERCRLPAPTLR